MKRNRSILNWLLLLMMTVGMTSCEELADAFFASEDNPAPSGSSTTTPDILIDNATLTLSVGQTASREASVNSADIQLTYASSTPAVATVSQTGKVTAITAGETTITVSAPQISKSVSFKVVVNAIPAEQLAAVDKATPLTFLPQDDGKITVTFYNGITLAGDIHFTINDGQEQTIAKNTTGAYDIQAKKGDVVQLYSINTSLGGGAVAGTRGGTRAIDEDAKYINIRPSMKTEIFGNVMSLLKGKDNLESATTIEANNAFYGLFAGAEKLVNNTERLLVLPATTLTEGCYQDMFNGCKGIEKAPELPAPKLEKNCYQEMFYDCAKLNSVRCLATDITAENSTKDWLGKAGTEATGEKVLET
ncbi:MAG: Ig-like domain-containing protein, partial [Prevotella sp.]|nr:Ig-like domain-containing protein [Prevotella sp.]